MAVTSGLTSFSDFGGSPVFVDYGGGSGSGVNTDIIIEGSQSGGRRSDSKTGHGFGVTTTPRDLSAANVHFKVWLWVTQWAAVTKVQVRLSDGSNNDDHNWPSSEFPSLGGFVPLWLDVSRTPEIGGSANEAAINEAGVLIDIGNVGGNAANLIEDEMLYGTTGLKWSGAGGSMSDFRAYESSNNEGNLVRINGVDFVYTRLTIGDSFSTEFTDSGFKLIFVDQPLVSTTFMGLTADLSHASTGINLSNCSIESSKPLSATRRPDLTATGTAGSLAIDTASISGLRTLALNSACAITNSTLSNNGVVDAAGASLIGSKILNANVAVNASALSWNVATDPDGLLDGASFTKGATATHAIELGISSPTTLTLTDVAFAGYNAANGQDDSAIHVRRTSGTVTINIQGGDSPSYKSDGAVVSVVNTVSVKITAKDAADSSPVQGARVLLEAAAGGDLPVGTEIINELTTSIGVADDPVFAFTNNQPVSGRARKGSVPPYYKTAPISGTITNAGLDLTVFMVRDE